MLSIAEIEPYIDEEFGSRLTPLGFKQVAKRKWVRSCKLPIRELFTIGMLKGCRYSPVWGISSGIVPAFRAQTFKTQSTDKNAVMDLIIDPVDAAGIVPLETFGFIPGFDTEIPKSAIRACAARFVPAALTDFARVSNTKQFCGFFIERSRLRYARFTFEMYLAHRLTIGFVHILSGRSNEGVKAIREFCEVQELPFEDRILQEHIQRAEAFNRGS